MASPSAGREVAQKRSRILVLSLSDITLDGRIRRQIAVLAPHYEVIVAAPGQPLQDAPVHFLKMPSVATRSRLRSLFRVALRRVGRYEQAYWLDGLLRERLSVLKSVGPVDATIVNDLWALPLAFAASDAPVVFDSHEHWTSESASWTTWERLSMRSMHEWIVDRLVPRTAAMMTVSRGIAKAYQERAGVVPKVVTNAPFHRRLQPSPVREPIRLVHIGYADQRRRIEDTVEAVRTVSDRFTLDLVLARSNEYRRWLERLVEPDANIRVLPPVPNDELITFANSYDVGVFLLPARFPNQLHVLPNKLFEYIQARLAVAIGPSPEMVEVVREWDCGVISHDFSPESFAAALATLTPSRVERMKRNAHAAARVLTAENNQGEVLDLMRRVTQRSASDDNQPAPLRLGAHRPSPSD